MVAANQGGTLGAAIPWATAATLAALRGEMPDNVYNADAVAEVARALRRQVPAGSDEPEQRSARESYA